jgi:hypothetical protein
MAIMMTPIMMTVPPKPKKIQGLEVGGLISYSICLGSFKLPVNLFSQLLEEELKLDSFKYCTSDFTLRMDLSFPI